MDEDSSEKQIPMMFRVILCTFLLIVLTAVHVKGSRGLIVSDNQTIGSSFPMIWANIPGNTFTGISGHAGNGQFMRLKLKQKI